MVMHSNIWVEDDAVEVLDREPSGAWFVRRLAIADGCERLRVYRPLGEVLGVIGGIQVRNESSPRSLVGLSHDDLGQVWSRPWHPGPQMPTAVSGGLVLCGDSKRRSVVCVDVRDGSDKWSFSIPPRELPDHEADAVASGKGIVAWGGDVAIITLSGRLFKLDSATGAVLFEGVRPAGQPFATKDGLWFVGVDGMHRVSASTMRSECYVDFRAVTEGTQAAGWPRIHGVAYSDPVVAFRTSGGDLVALIRDGTKWQAGTAEIGGIAPFFEAPVIANDRIYCLDRVKYELLAFQYQGEAR